MTQIEFAKQGIVTPQMEHVSGVEQRPVEFIMQGVASGRIVIPANINHKSLIPCGIGRMLKTKINANLGNSTLSSCPGAELNKLKIALHYGADTVMDLSTGGEITGIRQRMLEACSAPLGTVPVYEIVARYGSSDFSREKILSVIHAQAEQGVDYMTIHAGLLQKHIPLALKRKLGIVSRGGALLAAWMTEHKKENPFYEAFDDILEICRKYDVTLSLGDGLRPGCLADASDAAQFAELETLGELVARCRKANVQAMRDKDTVARSIYSVLLNKIKLEEIKKREKEIESRMDSALQIEKMKQEKLLYFFLMMFFLNLMKEDSFILWKV